VGLPTDGRFDYDTYLSRFTWRYSSTEMRRIFSEVEYRKTWREIWYCIAKVQSDLGLITEEELADILEHKEQVDIPESQKIERENRHDLMAELKFFASQCPKGGGKIHLGATSSDIEDNADIIRMRKASQIIILKLLACLKTLRNNVARYAETPCMGWTHLQPAEPSTLGYRFANYAQDIFLDIKNFDWILNNCILGKGIRGAVGTSASYETLLNGKITPNQMEKLVLSGLRLTAHPVSTQTYPRKVDFLLLSALASIAQSANKIAFDIRILQSPVFGELSETHCESQVGSTAMPFKHNPINCERICSLCRYVMSLTINAWINGSENLLERTLDDSANRHLIIPESFLAIDEILTTLEQTVSKLEINEYFLKKNLMQFRSFVGTEKLLMKLVAKGADRQEMHKRIEKYSNDAWQRFNEGRENQLIDWLKEDVEILKLLGPEEIADSFDVQNYVGDAGERCRHFIATWVDPIINSLEKQNTN
jgi:adenylosuccinate lyase